MKINLLFSVLISCIMCQTASLPLAAESNSEAIVIPPNVIKAIKNHISANSWKKLYYDVLPKVISENNIKSLVEVGVGLGGHAETILQNTKIEHYYGIDPYIYNVTDGFMSDVANYSSSSGQKNCDYLFEWIKNYRLAPYADRCHLLRETSVVASSHFEKESIDCIFIDGDHRYTAVLNDLASWYPKVKKGGMILGDDYWMSSVSKAVDQFFKAHDKKITFITSEAGYKIWVVCK